MCLRFSGNVCRGKAVVLMWRTAAWMIWAFHKTWSMSTLVWRVTASVTGGGERGRETVGCERGLVWISVFIKVRYSGLCDGGSLEQTLQFFASICHFKVNVRCTMWWLWSNDSICTFKTHFHNAVLSANGSKNPWEIKVCWWSRQWIDKLRSCPVLVVFSEDKKLSFHQRRQG